jgi:putative transcriptional regulator
VTSRVRELRTARDWTQAELAERLGVSRQTVISIENGRYEPSLSLAFKIAAVFQLRIEDVFSPDDTPRSGS